MGCTDLTRLSETVLEYCTCTVHTCTIYLVYIYIFNIIHNIYIYIFMLYYSTLISCVTGCLLWHVWFILTTLVKEKVAKSRVLCLTTSDACACGGSSFVSLRGNQFDKPMQNNNTCLMHWVGPDGPGCIHAVITCNYKLSEATNPQRVQKQGLTSQSMLAWSLQHCCAGA